MKPFHIILIMFVVKFSSCGEDKKKALITARDTTITRANAVTNLFIDSTALAAFIEQQHITDSVANLLRNFYNVRNFQYAWFTNNGLAEQGQAFWNLCNSYISLSKDSMLVGGGLRDRMELYKNDDTTVKAINDSAAFTELQLTELFFVYAQYAYAGKVDPAELQWHIARKKLDAMAVLDSLLANNGQNAAQWEPVNRQYTLMYAELKHYDAIEKAGGWKPIAISKINRYKTGDSALAIKQTKQRFIAAGGYDINDTSAIFTTGLFTAIKASEKSFGLKEDGMIDEALIKALNIPVKDRIEQMLVNMERMRWLPKETAGERLVANIPEFKLHVFDSAKKVFDIDIVVGTAVHKTVIFNDTLKYVVFSPYWNVPRSIVRNEIMPGIRKNANYLARHNMERTGYSSGLPVIRQKPGGSNALGKVKFIFPNSYNIYFHDTPSKSLFDRQNRAFSHGCVRLAEPKKMAEYLLRNQPEWTADKINQAMNASKEKWVTLNTAVPVTITYFTSWISSDGVLNFREDIYGRDKEMAERLFDKK